MSFKNEYKVTESTVKNPAEFALENDKKQLELILNRELNNKEDAYENIIEMERFLSYPHDNLPGAQQKIYEKYDVISRTLGKDILDKGIEISNSVKALHEMFVTIDIKNRGNIKNEIINNPDLASRLSYLRYHPEVASKQKGSIVEYEAVYSDMVEEIRENSTLDKGKNSNDVVIDLLTEYDRTALETMLNRELNSREDVYENIVEMKHFLSYPHGDVPEANNKINEKLEAIKNTFGQDILAKGLEISDVAKFQHESFVTMSLEERLKCEKEILENSEIAEQLSYLRYHPEISMKQSGPDAMIGHKAVYSNMIEEMNSNEYHKINEEKLNSKVKETKSKHNGNDR